MRKILWISFLLVTSALVASCSNDDESGNNDNVDSIVGSWKVSDIKVGGFSVYDVIVDTEAACFLETSYQFNYDHTLIVRSFIQNPESETIDCIAAPEQTGEWSKSGEVYTITVGEESVSETIEFSDYNSFIMTYEMDEITYSVIFSRQ